MRVPLWLKIGWTVWLTIWTPVYWRQYGAQNFLFFCDLGNVLIGIGLWMESPLIFSWVASGLLLFQTIFAIDFLGALLSGHHIVGGTEYMFDPGLPVTIRLLSLFHVVTPPLLLWAILASGLRPARMEVADADGVDCGADQLFLAARAGCELGAGAVLSRAACDAGVGLSARVFDRRADGRLFSDAFIP